MRYNTKDWSGRKFNMLTFVAPHAKDAGGRKIWKLLCECGNTTYAIPHNVVAGSIKSCGCYSKSIRKSNGKKCRKQHPIISSAKVVWRTYKDGVIDFDNFYRISQLPCHYCGCLPHKIFNVGDYPRKKGGLASDYQLENGNFTYNGLDRIDSSKEHSLDNIVPCCWDCNRMKGTMSKEDFITHIKLILNHQNYLLPHKSQ